MSQIISEKIEETKEEIDHLKEMTKPVEPDNAYGRLSRMDAINNKTINVQRYESKKAACKSSNGRRRNWKKAITALVLNAEMISQWADSNLCLGLHVA